METFSLKIEVLSELSHKVHCFFSSCLHKYKNILILHLVISSFEGMCSKSPDSTFYLEILNLKHYYYTLRVIYFYYLIGIGSEIANFRLSKHGFWFSGVSSIFLHENGELSEPPEESWNFKQVNSFVWATFVTRIVILVELLS